MARSLALTLRRRLVRAAAAALLVSGPAAHAAPGDPSRPRPDSGASVALRVGTSLRLSGDDLGTEELGLEVRFPWDGPLSLGAPRLAPLVGFSWTEDDARFAFAGLRYDLELGGGWRLTPSLVGGHYERNGGHNLGASLQFRTQVEVTRRVSERLHVGVSGYHMSNGDLGDTNPGAEFLSVVAVWRP